MSMRLRSLETRIAALFLVLILLVQVVGMVLLWRGIDGNASAAVATELMNGEKVLRKLMEQNGQTQRFSAQVLARDTAFVEAVGNGGVDDIPTIQSALENTARRARADLTMLLDTERQVKVHTGLDHSAVLEAQVARLLDPAERRGAASGVAMVGQRPVQLVVVPVRAPITIAWVVMGFFLDAQLAGDMKELSALEVAILGRAPDGSWQAYEATLDGARRAELARALQGRPATTARPIALNLGDSKYSAQLVQVGDHGRYQASVVLAASLDAATEPYRNLHNRLLLLTATGIVVAGVAAVLAAKRIARPISELAGTARRLEHGDYHGRIDTRRHDEIGDLAKAFDSMREGIARREHEIRRLAYWDSLTGLPNRARLVELLEEALDEARARGHEVHVLMLDLDRFKNVNDVLGHSFGDALLCRVAERLLAQMAGVPGAQLARLSGDEFVVLLPGAGLAEARNAAAAILAALEAPVSMEDQTVDLGAGVGIAGYPAHGGNAEQLLSMAEVAMYTAKQRNDGAVVYDGAIDKASETSLGLLTELRSAVENHQLRLHVQPKTRLDTGQVVGAEALVRWMHPERGNVFPDEFIPFAEQTGFIRVLTRWVLDRTAALGRQLADQGVHIKLSVNLSTRDLLDQDLPAKFKDILERHGLGPESFCLEITESAIMDDPVRAQHTLERLAAMGVDLSIDDFGTGYSSLAYLKRLPVTELKIDKSFVLNMENDIGDTKIVRSTIDLGHNMGLRVVAEGIESEAVWQLLSDLGCDQGQGYLISRPIPAERLADWIAGWRPPADVVLRVTDIAA
jgi:diguanylate cyclase (GGDEF)-like protein